MLSHMQALRIAPRWRWDAIWHWWRDGLLAWLPASLRRWLGGASRRLVVAVDDRECVLLCEETDRTRELERLDRLAPDWNAVAGWFKAEKPCQLVLRFPTSQALIRTLSLPSATEKNLRQVAGFEMDRLTPFAAAQVYYDATVLAQLRQRDLQPDALEVAGGRPGLNLLPPEQRGHRDLWVRRLRGVLIVATLLLVAVAAILPIWQQRALVLGTMAKASRLQQAANQALALRDQLDRTLEASRMLAQKKQTVPTRVDVLRELTSILPDDTWLERLQIKGDTAQLIGQSAKASALVGAVESSKLFNGAGFASPVTTDPRTGKERFVLGARIGKEL